MPLDLQLTLLSTFLLMAAVAWPVLFNVRSCTRLAGPRSSAATPSSAAQATVFAGSAVLSAAGTGLLVVAGLL